MWHTCINNGFEWTQSSLKDPNFELQVWDGAIIIAFWIYLSLNSFLGSFSATATYTYTFWLFSGDVVFKQHQKKFNWNFFWWKELELQVRSTNVAVFLNCATLSRFQFDLIWALAKHQTCSACVPRQISSVQQQADNVDYSTLSLARSKEINLYFLSIGSFGELDLIVSRHEWTGWSTTAF